MTHDNQSTRFGELVQLLCEHGFDGMVRNSMLAFGADHQRIRFQDRAYNGGCRAELFIDLALHPGTFPKGNE